MNISKTTRITKVKITPVVIDGVLDTHNSPAKMSDLENLEKLINDTIASIIYNNKDKNCTIDNVSIEEYSGSSDPNSKYGYSKIKNSGKYAIIEYSYDTIF